MGSVAGEITPSDGELLALFVQSANGRMGDEAAFVKIVERHGRMVWRVCHQVLPRRQDAEDAFQVTFLHLARQARKIRSSESAAGWLYRVAFRTAMAARRSRSRRRESSLETEPLAPPETAFPDLQQREIAAAMMEELEQLPVKYRTPLVQRYLEGRSRREIAEQTDTTVATVQGLLARGKKQLRSRLMRRGVSLAAAMAIVSRTPSVDAASSTVVHQTTSNAAAVVTGNSLAASTAVLSLFREGARSMFVSQFAKPAAVVVVLFLVSLSAALSGSAVESTEAAPARVELQAEPPAAEIEAAPVAVAQAVNQNNQPILVVYKVADLLDEEGQPGEQLQALAERLKAAIRGNSTEATTSEQLELKPHAAAGSLMLIASANGDTHEKLQTAIEAERAKKLEDGYVAPGDAMLVQFNLKGGIRQMSLRVKQDGSLNLAEFSSYDYGSLQVAGLSPKKVVHAIAGRLREIHNDPQILVTLVHEGAGYVDEGAKTAEEASEDGYVAQPGDRIILKFKSKARAANGEYDIRTGTEAVVIPEGAAALTFPLSMLRSGEDRELPNGGFGGGYGSAMGFGAPGEIGLPMGQEVFIVQGKTAPSIKSDITKHLAGLQLDSPDWGLESVTIKPRARANLLAEGPGRSVAVQPLRSTYPANTVPRPTPQNGLVSEYWPNGELKAEREYRSGKLVSAIEYSDTGQVLYEMSDDEPAEAKSKSEPAKEAKPTEPPKPPTEKERLLAHKKRLEEKLEELQRHGPRDVHSKSEQTVEAAIRTISIRISEIILEEADVDATLEDLKEQKRPVDNEA